MRDSPGSHVGTGFIFHESEGIDDLPHGEGDGSEAIESSQTRLDERLRAACAEFERSGYPFGVLWITIDQAHDLRRTHGVSACDAMLRKIQRTLLNGLRPGEGLGRWGHDEFPMLSHEPFAAALATHAQFLAGAARMADLRWWGDRISLTVSIGAAQAGQNETLAELLERAQSAMIASIRTGGNRITMAPRRFACSRS